MTVIRTLAPAKLNLALAVGPLDQEAGLHPICSWMVPIDLGDDLEIRALPQGSLSRYAIEWHKDARRRSPIDWPLTSDLSVRAHLALEEHIGEALPIQMTLRKRIPVGSGLGGGSSDAGTMLSVINAMFDLGIPLNELRTIAHGIGSDVPFFVAPSPALVRSFGEVVQPIDSAGHLHAVLVLPDEATNTGGVYRAFDEQDRRLIDESRVERLIGSASGDMALFNDLSTPAYTLSPKLASIAAEVSRLVGRPAHLSGSGSAHFVVADDLQHACDLAGTIERQLDLPAIPVKTLDPDA